MKQPSNWASDGLSLSVRVLFRNVYRRVLNMVVQHDYGLRRTSQLLSSSVPFYDRMVRNIDNIAWFVQSHQCTPQWLLHRHNELNTQWAAERQNEVQVAMFHVFPSSAASDNDFVYRIGFCAAPLGVVTKHVSAELDSPINRLRVIRLLPQFYTDQLVLCVRSRLTAFSNERKSAAEILVNYA
jgi:hypothetical protein